MHGAIDMADPRGPRQQTRSGGDAARRWLRTVALGFAALLAGCVGAPRGGPPPIKAPPPIAERPAPPRGLPEDAERHRVALLVPLSGANGAVGQSIANAANLALLDAGSNDIRITTYDTSSGAGAAAQKALAEGNGLILGPLLGQEVREVTPVAAAAHVPVVAFSNDASAAGRGAYLLGFFPGQAIARVVDYAAARGLKRLGALVPAGTYGERASNAILKAANDAGGSVVAMETYDRSPASLSAAAKKLGGGYDAVMIADSGRIALVAAPLVRRASPGVRLLGTELWNTEPSLGQTAAMQGGWFASVSDGIYNQFAAKYRARYGRGPYRLASLGYDAVLLALRIAPAWRMNGLFPESRLEDSGGFSGVDGAFRFGADGIAERMLEVKQVGAGGFVTVSPAPGGFAQ